jgi:putative transcriptional regulator
VLDDPNFFRSVVLVCVHDDEGAFGLVLNEAIQGEITLGPEEGAPDVPIASGGPVEPQTAHVLHRVDGIEGAEAVVDGLYWGGSITDLAAALTDGRATLGDVRFYAGYAGWSAGQLAEEIERGDWLVHPARPAHLFETAPNALWAAVLREMGPPHSYLVHFPADPRMN